MKGIAFIFAFVLMIAVAAADTITYDFDEVNVLYAARFEAAPVEGSDSSDTWVSDIAEDDENVEVTYGVVELKRGDQAFGTEEFIRIEGSKGYRRFLVNSGTYLTWDGTSKSTGETTTYTQMHSFFWSAKKLEGTAIVKDFTEPVFSSCFSRRYVGGAVDSFSLSFSEGFAADQECTSGTAIVMYQADVESIEESGDSNARSI